LVLGACILGYSFIPQTPKIGMTWRWAYLLVPGAILLLALLGDGVRQIWQSIEYNRFKTRLARA
jgi:hypothetical protein